MSRDAGLLLGLHADLVAAVADHLRARQWNTDPEHPELHARSAHDRHGFSTRCAICARDVERVTAAVIERVTAELAQTFRAAAEGRRGYARNASAEVVQALELQAVTLDGAAKVITGDPGPLYDWLPSYQWTPAMTARLYPERQASA